MGLRVRRVQVLGCVSARWGASACSSFYRKEGKLPAADFGLRKGLDHLDVVGYNALTEKTCRLTITRPE